VITLRALVKLGIGSGRVLVSDGKECLEALYQQAFVLAPQFGPQQVANVLWSMSVMSIPRGGAMHHDRPTVYDLLITASEALTPPITAAAPTASATASAWRGAERFTKRGRRLWRR